jgi:hypothetical protein
LGTAARVLGHLWALDVLVEFLELVHALLQAVGDRQVPWLDHVADVRLGVRLRPEVLEGVALERLERGPTGELVDTARGRPGEALEVVGQGLLTDAECLLNRASTRKVFSAP